MKFYKKGSLNKVSFVLKVSYLCLSAIFGTYVNAQTIYYPNFIDTIQNGNWVWSSQFANENRALMAYASGAFNQLRLECPSLATSSDAALVEAFIGGSWIFPLFGDLTEKSTSNTQETITSLADMYATAGGYSIAGQRDVQQIIESRGCDSSNQKYSRNLVRLASGRRPEISSLNGTLDEEKITPLEVRHQYDEQIDNLQYQGAMLVESDIKQFSSAGVQILECYYDKDPKDQYRELQFYWALNSVSSAAVSAVPFTHMLLNQRQQKLNEAQRFPRVRHPFLVYGSPMPECPSMADESYPSRKIRVHRERDNIPYEDAVYPQTAPKPELPDKGCFWIYKYGKVPEDYVPPVPENYKDIKSPCNQESPGRLKLSMEKAVSGSLNWVEVEPFHRSVIRAHWEDDFGGIFTDSTKKIDKEIVSLYGKGLYTLTCWYLSERDGYVEWESFWFANSYPEGFDPDSMRSRWGRKHPLLRIHTPQQNCPSTHNEALAIINRE